MKKHTPFLFALSSLSILALAGCGGAMGWEKDPDAEIPPAQIGWDYQGELPSAEDHLVAFVPKETHYKGVYCWDDAGNQIFGKWPGSNLTVTSSYDANWYQVDIPDYTKINIIWNGNGQTKDMALTHGGYWWFWTSDNDMHDEAPSGAWIDTAKFTDEKTINVAASAKMDKAVLYEGETELIVAENPETSGIFFKLGDHPLDLQKGYKVKVTMAGSEKEAHIDLGGLYSTDGFNRSYAYEGNDLGVTYTPASSTFKVWSPVSTSIKLRLYKNGTPSSVDAEKGSDEVYKEIAMEAGEKGIWSAVVNENLDGFYYTYVVSNANYHELEIVDPYARSAGVNGKRGMILDLASTNPEGWENANRNNYDRKQLAVWETHIADLTSSSTWTGKEENRKRFAGFHESGTTYSEGGKTVSTGFDHVKELGVNAVQILPMFDQDNNEINPEFNWGYNPLNYNVPEGVYSSNPYDGRVRVKELKALIADYNKAGINIIMDVVYNHVAGANKSNFDVLMPGYYFRYNEDGSLSNGSGCGNETASDHKMMRKFIIDSTKYWAEEYHLGGFRFDLMGLHDMETMEKVSESLKKVAPNIAVYGEPWTGGTTPLEEQKQAITKNGAKFKGYGLFSDVMRDALIKGGMNPVGNKGWITQTSTGIMGDFNNVVRGIKGTIKSGPTEITDPDTIVNYVTCHDNFTLHDRIAILNGKEDEATTKKMAMLANSIVFTSQGTSFMLAGDEFLRSKPDDGTDSTGGYSHNSYNKSYECNQLDYALKIQHQDMVEHYKKLIALKTKISGLRLGKGDAGNLKIETDDGYNRIVYEVRDNETGRTYKIAHASGANTAKAVDFSGYTLYLDTLDKAGLTLSGATPLDHFQTIIAYK
ncbi:MAG: type I pullulanase [Bacilli bacterium]|nr:type I pullulanase [Bacilli bacterium]